ncbi:MAG: ABC transporter permease subunit [Streptosporangiales bacterium]|nr:ABC transporter permease subunit [Streptosporangiales bacterium]
MTTTRATVPAPSASGRLSDRTFAVLLTLPALALLAVIVCYPLLSALFTSLFEQSLILPGRAFVGLRNFADVLGTDFLPVLRNTAVFTVFATVLPFLVGFALALALNVGVRGQSVLRGVFLMPWVVPGVVVSFVWLWIFNASYGLLNGFLVRTGVVDVPIAWLADPLWATVAIIVAKSWASFPWMMVMLLAGLQTVPKDLHEAAALDGAGIVKRFRHVTLPHLRGIIGIVLLLEFIWNFQHFDIIYVLTGGGPAGTTTTFAVSVYNTAFKGFDLGHAGAMGALWMAVLTVLVVLYIRSSERKSS